MSRNAIATRTDQERSAAPTGLEALRNDPLALGKVLAASGFFPDAKTEAAAAVKVIAGLEMGFGSIASMSGIHIIDQKPVLGANLLAAQVKRSGKYDYRERHLDNERCSLEFFQRVRLPDGKPGWESLGLSTFTWDDAVRAQVTGKKNWKTYPRNMLFARALSNGVTFYCPDLLAGAPVYTPEELDVAIDENVGEVIADIPPAQPPASVAASREQPRAVEQDEPQGDPINAGQKRKIFKLLTDAGIKERPERKAIQAWVAREVPLDRLTKDEGIALIDALKDWEAIIATIADAAEEGQKEAVRIRDRYLSSDPGPESGDPGPEQPELA
jgi:hypothetical protein